MIKLYTKTGCPYCAKKREEFQRTGVAFQEINIYEIKGAKEELLALTGGKRLVPVIVDGANITIAPQGG